MPAKRRINLKLYFSLSLVCYAVVVIKWFDNQEFLKALSVILFANIIHHLLTIKAFSMLLGVGQAPKRWKIFLSFVVKTLVLFSAFYLGVQMIADGIVFGVILYIFQLLILGLSLKKKGI